MDEDRITDRVIGMGMDMGMDMDRDSSAGEDGTGGWWQGVQVGMATDMITDGVGGLYTDMDGT